MRLARVAAFTAGAALAALALLIAARSAPRMRRIYTDGG